MAKKKAPKFDPQWARAKKVCRLNMEDIRMAKALGMSPKTLMKNNPSPTQKWKLPVKYWIRELHEQRFGHKPAPTPKPVSESKQRDTAEPEVLADEIPF